MSFDILPVELILKIGELLDVDRDFVSFTLTNRRTFHIFSDANYLWRPKLDEDDQLASDDLKDVGPFSCPAKEIFFRRPNYLRNRRKMNFKVVDACTIPRPYLGADLTDSYKDFFVLCRVVDCKSLHFVWVDESSEENKIQSGMLTKDETNGIQTEVFQVFAASNKVLIVNGRDWKYDFLLAIDLTRIEDLRVMWETRRKVPQIMDISGSFYSVYVANFKIYKEEESEDRLTHIAILSAETGQTLSTLVLDLGGQLRFFRGPPNRDLMDTVQWISFRTENLEGNGKTEQFLNLETGEVCHVRRDVGSEITGTTISKGFMYTKVSFQWPSSDDLETGCEAHQQFEIPSEKLLPQETDENNYYFDIDFEKGVCRLLSLTPNKGPITTRILSTMTKNWKFLFGYLFRRCLPGQIGSSSFVSLREERGVDLSISAKFFGSGSEAPSRETCVRDIDHRFLSDHWKQPGYGDEEWLCQATYFCARSKVLVLVDPPHTLPGELVLLDFSI